MARRSEVVHRLETLSDASLAGLIGSGVTTVVVPFGSIERHGAHLPVGADALLADAVGREVARRLGAVLAPTVRTGYAERHGPVVSIHADTLSDVAFQLVEGLSQQGFRIIVLASSHGGNRVALQAAAERAGETLEGIICSAPDGDVGPEPGSYSGEWLTSVLLALHPNLVDVRAADRALVGELGAATPERGAVHFERFVSSIANCVGQA